jgi:hypothetical protein
MAKLNSPLEAKVKAVNAANEYVPQLYDLLVEIFKPFVGQRISKADGCLFKKINDLLPSPPNKRGLRVYRMSSSYSLVWAIQTCETYPSIAMYHETSVYIGNMRDGVLLSLCGPPEPRPAYRVEDIVAARDRYKEAKRVADEALALLGPFGEYE